MARINDLTGQKFGRLADIAGISRSTLSRYIATGKPLPGEVLIAWQKAFGWSADYLAFLCLGGPAPMAD